ncbi:MAG: hypothetical protein H0W89_06315 [Candidatus Levybacteria bacterium]|nr:hypothetical protein [Candidatus Levybacteria bacterium]
MKKQTNIIYTKHVLEKMSLLKQLGWVITKSKIKKTIVKPTWSGVSKHGEFTAMDMMKDTHILRVIFNREGDKIKVITVHVARRGRYESTL